MSDRAAFLKQIVIEPADDTVRLVYADWLEEYGGDPDYAGFIRAQVALARLPQLKSDYADCLTCGGDGWSSPPPYHRTCRRCDGTGKEDHGRYQADATARGDLGVIAADLFNGDLGYRLRDAYPFMRHTINEQFYTGRTDRCCLYRRGFIERLRVDPETWIEYADAMAWNPGQTEYVCDICNNTGQVGHPNGGVNYCPNRYVDGYLGDRCIVDERDRPFVETAQPILVLTITGQPTNDPATIRQQREWLVWRTEEIPYGVRAMWREEWPWIELEFTHDY